MYIFNNYTFLFGVIPNYYNYVHFNRIAHILDEHANKIIQKGKISVNFIIKIGY